MTRIVIYSADPWDSAISYLRIREPAQYLGWELYPAKTDAHIDVNAIDEADFIIIQRNFPRFPQCEDIIQKAKQKNIPVIYEIDDCIFNTPINNKQFEAYRYYFNGILRTIMEADRVIVSTKYLYTQLISFNRNICIFPNYLPNRLWTIKPPEVITSSIMTIGYMGSNTHRQDLDWLTSVLDHTLVQNPNVQLKIWGCPLPEMLKNRPEIHHEDINFQDYAQFVNYFQDQTCDFFIAPLLNTPFNQGKSGIKFLEYSALGIPGIYMKIDPYSDYVTDGDNGFLACDLQEWQDKIQKLISDEDTRRHLADNAIKTTQLHYMSDHFREWETAITGSPLQLEFETLVDKINPLPLIQEINNTTQDAVWDLQRELIKARQEIAAQNQKIVDLENEKRGLKEHLDNILNSRTWKMAKSMQSITGIFKSNKG